MKKYTVAGYIRLFKEDKIKDELIDRIYVIDKNNIKIEFKKI